MHQGDVYLVQANITLNQFNNDLTGTHITSTQPIAVFSGHQRATIPINGGQNSSRDCLIEEMNPVNTWGKHAFLTPFQPSVDEDRTYKDIYRIMACYNNSNLYIDSAFVITLNAGDFYQGNLDSAHAIYSNQPILVGQYKKTSNPNNINDSIDNGDPFLSVVPPK